MRDTGDGRGAGRRRPGALLGGAAEELSPEERARRERSREGSAGIVGYAIDRAVELAAFALSGSLFIAELRAGTARELPVPTPVVDPRPSPDGRHIAYVTRGTLRVIGGGRRRRPRARRTRGRGRLVRARGVHRRRGDEPQPRFLVVPRQSDRLLVARVDDSARAALVDRRPRAPRQQAAPSRLSRGRYAQRRGRAPPAASTGARTEVAWDRARYPYLARVHWSAGGPPLLLVQSRDQRSQLHLGVDPESGATRTVHADEDPDWLDLFAGVPAWAPDGRLVRIADEGGARVLWWATGR